MVRERSKISSSGVPENDSNMDQLGTDSTSAAETLGGGAGAVETIQPQIGIASASVVGDDDDAQAAESAASHLEAQIDDLTSDLGHWCLADLRGWRWRRRRAAVAAAAGDGGRSSMGMEESPMVASKHESSPSPRKDSQSGIRSPSSEKEFLRQRRREARRSMLRGVATTTRSSGRRKLEI